MRFIHALHYLAVALLLSVTGCASLHDQKRDELDRVSDHARAKLVLEHVGLNGRLNQAPGYIVMQIEPWATLGVGPMAANAVLLRSWELEPVLLDVQRVKLHGAYGQKNFTALVVLDDRAEVEQIAAAPWQYVESEHDEGKLIYFFADGKPSSVYDLQDLKTKPVH